MDILNIYIQVMDVSPHPSHFFNKIEVSILNWYKHISRVCLYKTILFYY